MRVIDWLLEDDNPPVKKQTLVNLLGEKADSPQVQAVSARVNQYPPIKTMSHCECLS